MAATGGTLTSRAGRPLRWRSKRVLWMRRKVGVLEKVVTRGAATCTAGHCRGVRPSSIRLHVNANLRGGRGGRS